MDDDDDDSQLNHNLCAIVIARLSMQPFALLSFEYLDESREIIQFLNCYDFDFDSQSIVIVYNMEMLFSSYSCDSHKAGVVMMSFGIAKKHSR